VVADDAAATGGPMAVTGLGWVGTRTRRSTELAHFYASVLHLPLVHSAPGFWVFSLPDSTHVEVFDDAVTDHSHFTTGPVVGFAVTDMPAAVAELRRAGIELVGDPGPTWQHFRGPDGNVYELVAQASAVPEPSGPPGHEHRD
jgi:catechol 2,3-dioxygenase-like lactoylglutathione lyase family enzyme